MDEVLVCAPNDDLLSQVLDLTIDSLVAAGFELQEEKIQRMPPWKHLGLEIGKRTIVPQILVVKNNIKTLSDVHQLCRSLNWAIQNQPSALSPECTTPSPPVPPNSGTGSGNCVNVSLVPATCTPSPECRRANSRELNSCEVWQTDVTHIMSFGRQRYVHVSVDTFSGAVYASAHSGEKSSDAMKHLIQAFFFLGIPKSIKTDKGPTYTSKEFRSFLQQWGVEHKTGIPYSPTGQAIVKRTHQNLIESSANNISL
ncbi:hypothetical protein DUI87_04857 [Hirundo rustica rustica]|uniref:Integrase catalytic domain-containing protein n=1 Tax=Hirundo rustica rustica TaxID=333673 RepID=A0A3M0KXU6_HIRRU|nr:hypothetical protein DUI87_04857 [Hirundo rustica rustica]